MERKVRINYGSEKKEEPGFRTVVADRSGKNYLKGPVERHHAILEAAAFASRELLRSVTWQRGIETVLRRLGEATNVSRVYLFENHEREDGTLYTSQRYEWTAAGVVPQIGNPELQEVSYVQAGFARWVRVMSRGGILAARIRDLPESEIALLRRQGILSIVVVPVFVNNAWWGFIGFDDCVDERIWTEAEVDALHIAGGVLGAAIEREKREETLRQLNETLEARVEKRTRRLIKANRRLKKDIALRKAAEVALRESEKRFRQLADAMPQMVWISSPDGKTEYYNQQLKEYDGIRYDGLVWDWLPAVHPDDRNKVIEAWQHSVNTGEVFESDHRCCRADGQYRWHLVRAVPIRDDRGQIVKWYGTATDIHTLKETRKALARNERLLRTILQQMPSGILVSEAPSGRLLFCNGEAARLLGPPFDTSSGSSDFSFYWNLTDQNRPVVPPAFPLTRVLTGEVVHEEELSYHRTDGTLLTLSVNAAPVRDVQGEIIMVVSTFHDISPLKAAQEEMHRLNETLERRVEERTSQVRALSAALALAERRERRRISYILHEDLQQILFGLDMQAKALCLDMPEETNGLQTRIEELQSLIRRAARTARRLSIELNPPVLHGDGLCTALRWLARHMHETYGLEVVLDTPDDVAVNDQDQHICIVQLVRELLSNVVKHAGVNHALVNVHRKGNWLSIRVEDRGTGFNVDEIFASSMKSRQLGLLSVQEQLRLFGGRTVIVTSPGAGTCIELQLPVYDSGTDGGMSDG